MFPKFGNFQNAEYYKAKSSSLIKAGGNEPLDRVDYVRVG